MTRPRLLGSTTVTTKNQLTLRKAWLEGLGVLPGDKLVLEKRRTPRGISLRPAARRDLRPPTTFRATLSAHGQLTLPRQLLRQLHLEPGEAIELDVTAGGFVARVDRLAHQPTRKEEDTSR